MSSEQYETLRTRALTRRSADLGLQRVAGRPVWGVAMEIATDDGVTTIVSTDDGAVSLLDSQGAAVHLAKGDWPFNAGTRLIGCACDFMFECSPAWAYPLPGAGMVRFYLLTFDGVMTGEAPRKELASGKGRLADLFYAGHDVSFLVRMVADNPDWKSYKPSIGQTLKPSEAPAEVPVPPTAPASGVSGSARLLRACANNDVDEVARLLVQGHDCGPNLTGITPLMAAAHAGAVEPLRLLLSAGVVVDAQESHGYTALMVACNAGHDVCARLLLGAGADHRLRDDEGLTALMFAAKNGHDDIVRLLMERGADPQAVNDQGVSAVSLATLKGHTHTVAILLSRQIDVRHLDLIS